MSATILRPALPLPPLEIGRPQVSLHWCLTRDRDPQALALFLPHYSCQKRGPLHGNHASFGGQGGSMVLIGATGRALFVWRAERFRLDGQAGVVCSVFRNVGEGLSSEMTASQGFLRDLFECNEIELAALPEQEPVDVEALTKERDHYRDQCRSLRRLLRDEPKTETTTDTP